MSREPIDRVRREKFRGAVLGAAVGDALGAPFEGWRDVSADAFDTVANATEALRWTDDTHMTIAAAESLLSVRGFDGADMARSFVAAYRQEPWRGYAPGPCRVFAAINDGAPWDEPARELFDGAGSFGNGGAMRAAPPALLRYRNIRGAADLARRCAAITHTHELALQGAAVQAAAVAHLVGDRRAASWSGGTALIEDLRMFAAGPEFQRKLDVVAAITTDDSVDTNDVAKQVGSGVAAVESVPAALCAFLRNAGSYRDTVRTAILMGGDTDTIASMAGALSGALHGVGAIPEPWLARIEQGDRLIAIADGLLELAATPLSAIPVD